jgi:hypothetical protein
MTIIGFLIILVISFVLSYIFVITLSSKGPWGNFWTFFLILFLGILAVSFWLIPVGPAFGGARWASLLVAGLILALMLAMAGVTEPKKQKRNAITGKIIKVEPESKIKLSAFFWILIAVFALAIIIGTYI